MAKKRKRVHAAAAAMVLDVTAISLLQYLDAWDDALALLQALPAATMSAPLAAIKELLSTSPATRDQWPSICIERLEAASVNLAFAALPALPWIKIHLLDVLSYCIQGHFSDLGAFLAACASKIKAIDDCIDDQNAADILPVLAWCTHLEQLCVEMELYGAFIPRLPISVHELRLETGASSLGKDAAAPLRPWLGRGRGRTLGLINVSEESDAASFAKVLVTATCIQTVDLSESDAIVHALIALNSPLHHWRDVTIGHFLSADNVQSFLRLLDLESLTRLDITTTGDMICVFDLLSRMPRLEELAVGDCVLRRALPATPPPSSLARLSLQNLRLPEDAMLSLLDWSLGLQQLESIHLEGMDVAFNEARLVFTHWIATLAAQRVRLVSCDIVTQVVDMLLEAMAVRPRNSEPLELDLSGNDLEVYDHVRLLEALAEGTLSTLQLSLSKEKSERVLAVAHRRQLRVETREEAWMGTIHSFFNEKD